MLFAPHYRIIIATNLRGTAYCDNVYLIVSILISIKILSALHRAKNNVFVPKMDVVLEFKP